MTYARKADGNHGELREAARREGYYWFDLFRLPGALDALVVSKSGVLIWVEVKMPGEKMTAAEQAIFDEAAERSFPVVIWETVDQMLHELAAWDNVGYLWNNPLPLPANMPGVATNERKAYADSR